MESDDDFQTFSSPDEASSQSPVRERKLKRLKKAVRVSQEPPHLDRSDGNPLNPDTNSSKSGAQDFQESNEILGSGSRSEELCSGSALDSGFTGLGGEEDVSGAKRALDFDAIGVETDEKVVEDRRNGVQEENEDVRLEELEKKRPNADDLGDEKNKKKKKRTDNGSFEGKPKRMTEKERRNNMKQLHAESQRLLRESRDTGFKAAPIVHKPISSVLEKIRQRKHEISKKSVIVSGTYFIDDDDSFSTEVIVNHNIECFHVNEREDNRVSEATIEKTIAHPTEVENDNDRLHMDGYNDNVTYPSCEKVASKMAVVEESKQEFRAPIDDTQDLFSDSQTSDAKDDQMNETPSSPLEETFAPSILVMNLKFDSAPHDDVSTDEEDNDKENVDPHPHGLADSSSSPLGDPVKAFVDDEAEEEDDSDNDLMRFQNNDEDEDDGDAEELNDMIATGYEEQPIDKEKRNELHQKWLEQQDAVGTENLLQKLKCGSKLRETTLLEEKEVAEGEEDEGVDYEESEDLVMTNIVRMNLRKVKQMIPQMFTDNDNAYFSDDEETERRLTKQCLLGKAEERATFLSPAEDESSKEIFGRIKKLNIVPSNTKKAKTFSSFDMPLTGGNRNISSKSSFLGRGSTRCLPSSKKRGSGTARSFIFNEMIPMVEAPYQSQLEESSEAIEKQNRPRTAPVKFNTLQMKTSTQKSTTATAAMKPTTSLLDILRQTTLKSKPCPLDSTVTQNKSVLASFKLDKKPV
ncbi:uncharacterized protein LOC107420235 [Ziziphus jujuba]|uniref:Uncharacterized protein LOC107420235 n=1 Tax=Ziziphus jujuba TaxID=326968 RepID=A0A6P4A949_ZIZJJ|nr:uncharacterized protein LOC107420235 [Ziziphus jujuba]